MLTAKDYSDILKSSIDMDENKCRNILSKGMNYRDAQLYIESFYGSTYASKFIYYLSHCTKCGNVISKFDNKNLCASCRFNMAMSNISYDR